METEAIRSRGQAWTIEDRKELGELAAAGLCAASSPSSFLSSIVQA